MDQIHLKHIARKLSGELSQKESEEFDSWINSDSNNQLLFKQIEKVWSTSGDIYPEYLPDTDAEWEKLKAKIESPNRQTKIISLRSIGWPRIAAAIIAIVVLGVTLTYMFSGDKISTDNNLQMVEITSADSAGIYYLPDSSKIVLNKNSCISYAKGFADTARMTYLIGEAYFEVRKNGKAFIVYGGGTQVRVMGTAFNVKANERDDNVQVVVFEGQVAFSEQGSSPSSVVKLGVDDKIEFNKTEKEYKKGKNDSKDFWWKNVNSGGNGKLDKEVKKVLNKIKKGLRKK